MLSAAADQGGPGLGEGRTHGQTPASAASGVPTRGSSGAARTRSEATHDTRTVFDLGHKDAHTEAHKRQVARAQKCQRGSRASPRISASASKGRSSAVITGGIVTHTPLGASPRRSTAHGRSAPCIARIPDRCSLATFWSLVVVSFCFFFFCNNFFFDDMVGWWATEANHVPLWRREGHSACLQKNCADDPIRLEVEKRGVERPTKLAPLFSLVQKTLQSHNFSFLFFLFSLFIFRAPRKKSMARRRLLWARGECANSRKATKKMRRLSKGPGERRDRTVLFFSFSFLGLYSKHGHGIGRAQRVLKIAQQRKRVPDTVVPFYAAARRKK
ncbi:hypothetical protein TW95_gp1171 [Pandoravirus inopinatum]|uniref:Transmembrane protein n=1 Tax=Pandoravirus inopinatum TaxID=1605721 RepID=A0A0B5J7M6_9VIRU|nr:hypothetical protein TW95_gp1171 [Pandoravirus inopinatum]AJF97905.1 hypothetical protein [Pandoravirus inopinatum]